MEKILVKSDQLKLHVVNVAGLVWALVFYLQLVAFLIMAMYPLSNVKYELMLASVISPCSVVAPMVYSILGCSDFHFHHADRTEQIYRLVLYKNGRIGQEFYLYHLP